MQHEFQGKRILVTGGTGSIGFQIVRRLLQFDPKQIRVFSRDDSKQFAAKVRLNGDPRVDMLLGDIRDKDRLNRAMEDIDIVFHAGALKHVTGSENDPYEAVKTNVLGTQNVIECALSNGVSKVVGISTDKAADPTSVLGCTKLLAEKLMSATYHYKGNKKTQFCFVRFGNVIGTRGSVIPLFCWQIKNKGMVTLTDPAMYRFFMSIDDAVSLIFSATSMMRDREIFILKMPIIRVADLAEAVIEWYCAKNGMDASRIEIKEIGKRHGERIHEKLLGRDECENALERPDMFILKPLVTDADPLVKDSDYPDAKKATSNEYSTESRGEGFRVLSKPEIIEILNKNSDYIDQALW